MVPGRFRNGDEFETHLSNRLIRATVRALAGRMAGYTDAPPVLSRRHSGSGRNSQAWVTQNPYMPNGRGKPSCPARS